MMRNHRHGGQRQHNPSQDDGNLSSHLCLLLEIKTESHEIINIRRAFVNHEITARHSPPSARLRPEHFP